MKLEVNGQIVEVDDSFDKLSAADQEKTVNEIAASFGKQAEQPQAEQAIPMPEQSGSSMFTQPEQPQAMLPIAPMVPGPTITSQEIQAAKDIGKPLLEAATSPLQTYKATPWKAGVDLATTAATGVPVFGAASAVESLGDRARKISEAYGEASKFASQTSPTPGTTNWPGINEYRNMWNSLSPEDAAKLSNAYHNQGGPNGVKSFISSPEGQMLAKNNPQFAQAAAKYVEEVPGVMRQLGRVAAPVARTALNVLGPAATAYDVYQAGQVARQTQLGERLQQGQGKLAEQRFRSGMGITYQGPQLNPQEAQNVLSSGSKRDIQYFGGEDNLTKLIRQKAAEKALGGPVIPGQF